MSDTVLEHFLIRDYLGELSAACVTLPAAQARELRDQITAHLDEALPPGATDAEVRAELARLGRPRSLATEAAGPGGLPRRRRLRNRLGHVPWWGWVCAAALVAAVCSGLAYVLLPLNATPLNATYVSGWYYPQDRAHSVTTYAGVGTQYTVPDRFGQEQGFFIGVANNSDWTQTILGVDPLWTPFTSKPIQVAVGSGKYVDDGGDAAPVTWSSPGSIPPHSIRLLRVLWNSNFCMSPGGTTSIQDVVLTVRVGDFTRTEDIPLRASWALSGNKGAQCQ